MELLSQFILNPFRTYTIPSRIKNKKGISTFPAKHVASYLDYTVDFSNQFSNNEVIIQGNILCNHSKLKINSASFTNHSLTAFLSGGDESLTFYLTFTVKTNKGNVFFQEIILPTYGCFIKNQNITYKVMTLDKQTIIPEYIPPLNALKINGYCLINKKNSYIMV